MYIIGKYNSEKPTAFDAFTEESQVGVVAPWMNAVEESEVAEAQTDHPFKKDWAELDLVVTGATGGKLASLLEEDVFADLDKDADGKLSKEEILPLLEDSVVESLSGLTAAKMTEMKNNVRYPVYEVTEGMDAEQIEEVCGLVAALQEINVQEVLEDALGDDPQDFVQNMVGDMDQTCEDEHIEDLSSEDFHNLVVAASSVKYSDKIVVPAECETGMVRRRKLFIGAAFRFGFRGIQALLRNPTVLKFVKKVGFGLITGAATWVGKEAAPAVWSAVKSVGSTISGWFGRRRALSMPQPIQIRNSIDTRN